MKTTSNKNSNTQTAWRGQSLDAHPAPAHSEPVPPGGVLRPADLHPLARPALLAAHRGLHVLPVACINIAINTNCVMNTQ